MIKKYLSVFLSLSMLITFAACGAANDYNGEDIALLEPVGITQTYVKAEYRDLSSVNTYAGKVIPTVTEVSFDTNQNFKSYGSLPGTEVKKGDVIVYGSTEAVDKEIEALEEKISDALKSHVEFLTESNESMEDIEWNLDYYGKIVDNFESMNETEQANYRNYASEYMKYKAAYAGYVASKQKLEQSIKENNELYELDNNYDKLQLNNLKKKKKNVLATASADGTVVAINYYDNDAYIWKNNSVGAIGDFNNLIIQCEQIYRSDIKRSVDCFAVVNGLRYEIEYVEPDAGDAAVSVSPTESGKNFSMFHIIDPDGAVKAGDYVIVVLVKTSIKGALCVPSESLDSDEEGSLVYVLKDGTSTPVHVRTGIRSGLYTEILSGLSEGDAVVSDFKIVNTKKEVTLEKGSASSVFRETGYLYYPKSENINNPVKHGTAYVSSVEVKRYERVTKGQTIATIYVKADTINIKRLEREILRANEDLLELMKDEEKNKKAIQYKSEAINDLGKRLNEIKNDSKVTKIKAPFDGIITSVVDFKEGDILKVNAFVANIASEQNCFVVVEDKKGALSVGNDTLITYKNNDKESKEVIGHVVTVAASALSDQMEAGYTLIQVSPEEMAEMSEMNKGIEGWWMRSSYNVSAVTNSMDNIVLVPRKAVTIKDGVYYVTVKDADGNYKYKSFTSLGSDSNSFWCFDGLLEGDVICLD